MVSLYGRSRTVAQLRSSPCCSRPS
ncbi:MAG: hypothetical protein RL735_1504, partial [Pseudomonadota bacterium]